MKVLLWISIIIALYKDVSSSALSPIHTRNSDSYSYSAKTTKLITTRFQQQYSATKPINDQELPVHKESSDDENLLDFAKGSTKLSDPLSARNMSSRLDLLHKSEKIKMGKELPGTRLLEQSESIDTIEYMLMAQNESTEEDICFFSCPDAASLAPCICDPCQRNLNCSGVYSFTQLYDIFHTVSFPDTKFNLFLLAPGTWLYPQMHRMIFLDNTFGPVSFERVWLEETWVVDVQPDAFSGSENTLTELVFRWNNDLTFFPFTQLTKFTVLKKIEVTGSRITKIPTLGSLPHLHTLSLNQNKITNITAMAFAEVPSLKILDIGYNQIEIIPKDSLYFSASLPIVFLDHNSISYIDDNAFSNLQPGYLSVSNNNLDSLDEDVFQPILDEIINSGYESHVDAEDNPLCCANIAWILDNPLYAIYVLLPELNC